MSRVQIEPKDPGHEIVVGLDRPLNTFFIMVTEKPADGEDEEDSFPLEFKSRWSRAEVLERIEKYAVDSPRTQAVTEAILLDMDPSETVPEKIPKQG